METLLETHYVTAMGISIEAFHTFKCQMGVVTDNLKRKAPSVNKVLNNNMSIRIIKLIQNLIGKKKGNNLQVLIN